MRQSGRRLGCVERSEPGHEIETPPPQFLHLTQKFEFERERPLPQQRQNLLVRISQYCAFSIFSVELTADAIAARIGLSPDKVTVRGSRNTNPAMPKYHIWTVACRDRGLRIDDQISRLIKRLDPFAAEIGELANELRQAEGEGSGAGLSIIRKYNDAAEEEEAFEERTVVIDGVSRNLEKLGGQHQLFGWHIDKEIMGFLRRTDSELDVDEYDLSD